MTGQTSTFTFATNAISLPLISITPPQEAVGVIPEPHLGLALGAALPKSPEELIDNGEITLVFENNFDKNVILRTKQTCTWTKPTPPGKSSGATWAFSGFVKSSQESEYKTGERGTITVVVEIDGTITKTAAVT